MCSFAQMKGVTQTINKNLSKQGNFIQRICDVENEFIEMLQKTRQSLTKQFCFGSLEEKYRKLILKIYQDRDVSSIKGKEAD